MFPLTSLKYSFPDQSSTIHPQQCRLCPTRFSPLSYCSACKPVSTEDNFKNSSPLSYRDSSLGCSIVVCKSNPFFIAVASKPTHHHGTRCKSFHYFLSFFSTFFSLIHALNFLKIWILSFPCFSTHLQLQRPRGGRRVRVPFRHQRRAMRAMQVFYCFISQTLQKTQYSRAFSWLQI